MPRLRCGLQCCRATRVSDGCQDAAATHRRVCSPANVRQMHVSKRPPAVDSRSGLFATPKEPLNAGTINNMCANWSSVGKSSAHWAQRNTSCDEICNFDIKKLTWKTSLWSFQAMCPVHFFCTSFHSDDRVSNNVASGLLPLLLPGFGITFREDSNL